MARNKSHSPEARAARDALLGRAQWIVDSNIRAACGLAPVLPPDLVDFNNHDPGIPSIASLNGLLKSVMPAIEITDDRRPILISGESAVQQAESLLGELMLGEVSLNEADFSMKLIKSGMEVGDRAKLVAFIAEFSEKHNIQLKSF